MILLISFQAIQRLSGNDDQFIIQICDVLNKVFTKGKEIDEMKQKIKDFREQADTTDDQHDNQGKLM